MKKYLTIFLATTFAKFFYLSFALLITLSFITDRNEITPIQRSKPLDFDGNGASDFVLFRSSDEKWYVRRSLSSGDDIVMDFGFVSDRLVPADYDGDGKTDFAVFRPSQGKWYIHSSGRDVDRIVNFGSASDCLVPADYDGDGKTDIAVFRPSEGKWYVHPSSGGTDWVESFGEKTDLLAPGDYDGDGKADFALFRPAQGKWFIRPSSGGDDWVESFGEKNDRLVPGDYDGDGKTDLVIFDPAQGKWYVRPSSGGDDWVESFGKNSDRLVPGDYDADGKTDFALFRPSEGKWYVRPSSGGDDWVKSFGIGTDHILPFSLHQVDCKPYDIRYNEVQQISSHNSYDGDRGRDLYTNVEYYKPSIYAQAEAGVRSFEFDLHIDKTGPFTGNYPASDWGIFHTSDIISGGENCSLLSQCLAHLKRWHNDNPNHEVITIWLQIVDNWKSDGHQPINLDNNRLQVDLPGLIFTPNDLLRRCPGSTTLQEAVEKCGWPTLEELKGKFIIILNGIDNDIANYLDDVNQYKPGGNNGYSGPKLCFVAPEEVSCSARKAAHRATSGRNIYWSNAVFFNYNENQKSDAQCISKSGLVTRMFRSGIYGGARTQEEFSEAINSYTHHIATDRVAPQVYSPVLSDECGKPFRVMKK